MKISLFTRVLGLLFFISFISFAQSKKAQSVRWPAKKADVQEVKERKLLVALPG